MKQQIWEARCPLGEKCGKGFKLLYKKHTRELAQETLAMHLFDRDKHTAADVPTWETAMGRADNDEYLTLCDRDYEAWYQIPLAIVMAIESDTTRDRDGNETQEDINDKGDGKGSQVMSQQEASDRAESAEQEAQQAQHRAFLYTASASERADRAEQIWQMIAWPVYEKAFKSWKSHTTMQVQKPCMKCLN